MPSVKVFAAFGLDPNEYEVTAFSSGLINCTYLLTSKTKGKEHMVLQQLNSNVFKNPEVVINNVAIASAFLARTSPGFLFPAPTASKKLDGEHWRISDYVADSVALGRAETLMQARSAASEFGKLTRLLSDCDQSGFAPAIPHFHDLLLRQQCFESAVTSSTYSERGLNAKEICKTVSEIGHPILERYSRIVSNFDFPKRIVHHDAKLSNVLLSKDTNEGKCSIDFDTLGPGYIMSDLGDLVRTLVTPADEEEDDLSKVFVRMDYYEAILRGYVGEMGEILTQEEWDVLGFAGPFIVYMQCIRFLTDHLLGDVYYKTKSEGHNLQRASNQLKLLQSLTSEEVQTRVVSIVAVLQQGFTTAHTNL